MRIAVSTEVEAPPEAVWEVIGDPGGYLRFMTGMTRWEAVGRRARGRGARYRTLMRVGSAEVGGEVEIVEHVPPRELAWTSVLGVDQRGRWRLRPRPDGRTHVELRFSYGVAGAGLAGWVAEQVAAPIVRGHLRRSLVNLKRQVEHEQRRRAAARRSDRRALDRSLND